MSTACEYGAHIGPVSWATHAVALGDPVIADEAEIELWCEDCVERVIHGLDDETTAGRVQAHRAVAAR